MTTNALSVSDGMSIMERAVSASKSTIVPELYQRNPDNCVIAINLADAMGLNVLTVMQYLYIVHKKPAWASVFAISRWNTCGKYSPIRYEVSGIPGKPGSSCTATSSDLVTGEVLRGTPITWEMVTGEDWIKNPKWRNMPEQMFRYRAASFLIKTYAPELLMGLPFADEREDAEVNTSSRGRKPLSQLRSVESEVIEPQIPAITDKPINEHATHIFNQCMTALDRAKKQDHLDWVGKHMTPDIVKLLTDDQCDAFHKRWTEVAETINNTETPEQAFRRCLAEIGPMDAKAANAHIKTFDSGDWIDEWHFELNQALEAKGGK